jgi:predicted nucleic acid-binding protein
LLVDLVTAPALSLTVCRDADDDAVLACALAARADLIVSGDKDLLVLQAFQGIPILTAAQALQWLKTPTG